MAVNIGFDPANFSLAKSMQKPTPMQGIAPVGGVQIGGGQDFLNKDFAAPGTDLSLSSGMDLGGGMDQGFDWGGAMKGFSDVGSGITSLAGAYNAYKQLGMMEDQFNFAKQAHNQNVGNQAAITNQQLKNQASATAQHHGYKVGSPEYNAYMQNATQVSGAPIG